MKKSTRTHLKPLETPSEIEYELPKHYQLTKEERKTMGKTARKIVTAVFWFFIGVILGSLIKLVYDLLK